jgi:predicted DNA-binding transcriptional regulator YafY
MNRIDRLTAMILLLQRGKRTAGEIASRFEVSKRTALRDIQALCEMGCRSWPNPERVAATR